MLIILDTYFCQIFQVMELIKDIENWDFTGSGIVTIGTFDGVHLGHKHLLQHLNQLKTDINQKSIVFTFDPHPRKVLFPEQLDLQLLTTLEERIDLIKQAGVDILVIYPFNVEFSQIEPVVFIKNLLCDRLKIKKLVIGYDHKFGKDRKGDINTFKLLAASCDYTVDEIPVQEINELNISSTRIRKALFTGDVKTASMNLGYNYQISGRVISGKKLGRTIGFPTANLEVNDKDKLIPASGVYLIKVDIDNIVYHGMMNIGTNPTTDSDNKLKLEVNIFNFDKEIYGSTLKVEFLERIRDEQKFNSVKVLVEHLETDENKCKELLKKINLS